MLRPLIRPIVRPLTRRVTEPGFGGWSPRVLFAAGEQGILWPSITDLYNGGGLYQDSAASALASVGDPVGFVADASGRGNHASQPTATARPTLQADASGRKYLQFDGVDDFLSCPFAPTAYPFTFAAAARADTDSDGSLLSLYESNGFYKTLRKGGIASIWYMDDRANASRPMPWVAGTLGVPHVLVGKALSSLTSVSCDGGAVNSMANPNAFGAPTVLLIGNMRLTSPIYYAGRIYGALLIGADLSAGHVALVQRYLASKSGAVLA